MVHWDLSSGGCSFSALGLWLSLPGYNSLGSFTRRSPQLQGLVCASPQHSPEDPAWKAEHTGLFHSHNVKRSFPTVRAPSSPQFLLLPNPPHHHSPASTGDAAVIILAPWLEQEHERFGAFQLVLFGPMDPMAGAALSAGEELSQVAAPAHGRCAQNRVGIDARRG